MDLELKKLLAVAFSSLVIIAMLLTGNVLLMLISFFVWLCVAYFVEFMWFEEKEVQTEVTDYGVEP